MGNKINVSELLKDCPQGMELDCVMYEDVYFDHVDELNIIHCYIQNEGFKTSITFNQHGTPHSDAKSKCVIFPKGKTTWEGFHRPFRDGDIITCNNSACTFVSIFKDKPTERSFRKHCSFILDYNRFVVTTKFADYTNPRFATEEEKAKLFQTIKDNGYRWNEKDKTLEKLIKPIFKKGDKVRVKKGFPEPRIARIIEDVCDTFYTLVSVGKIDFTDQNNWELVPDKFDISKLKPFDEVLFRMHDKDTWCNGFYGFYKNNRHVVNSVIVTKQCIPYKGNEHLINTTDKCNEFYETWE